MDLPLQISISDKSMTLESATLVGHPCPNALEHESPSYHENILFTVTIF